MSALPNLDRMLVSEPVKVPELVKLLAWQARPRAELQSSALEEVMARVAPAPPASMTVEMPLKTLPSART